MKALVLSGGLGTRLRPLSFAMPKQLVPVANQPVLVHCLATILEAGITEVGIVVGDGAAAIRSAVDAAAMPGLSVTYIHQPEPLGLGHCVLIARDFLGDDDFVMYLGDNVIVGGIVEPVREFVRHRTDAQLMVTKVSDPSSYGVVELDDHGEVVCLEEKPPHARSDLAVMGVYLFSAAIHDAVRAIRPSARNELEITDAVQWLLTNGGAVGAHVFDGEWLDTGQLENLLECNRMLLDRRTPCDRGWHDEASTLHGSVVIEPGVRIIRSRIEGPTIIGAGTLVEDSHIGPYTAVGDNSVLRDSSIEDSIVLARNEITGVRGLHASVLGADVRLAAGTGARGYRLVLCDSSTVDLP